MNESPALLTPEGVAQTEEIFDPILLVSSHLRGPCIRHKPCSNPVLLRAHDTTGQVTQSFQHRTRTATSTLKAVKEMFCPSKLQASHL